MDFHIAEIDLSSPADAQPSSLWEGVVALQLEEDQATFGYTDLVETDTAAALARIRTSTDQRRTLLLALAGRTAAAGRVLPATGDTSVAPDDVLGYVWVEIPLLDNEHLGYLDLLVRIPSRDQGIGTALLADAERILRAHDRTTALGWNMVTAALVDTADDRNGTLLDPSGTVRIRTDHHDVRFALAHGYAFSQAERHSVQPLPVPEDVLSGALAEAQAKAAGYELVQFLDAPHDGLLEGLVPLFADMATDPPLGAVDWRPEVWDVDRVRMAYSMMTTGRRVYTTCARHIETGELAAFTQLKAPDRKPEVVYQENTLVRRNHRGHALGLWVKAANCAWISQDRPSSRRVHTWNADENDHMLDINTRLGYRRESIGAAWQKVLA